MEENKIICPICNEAFENEQEQALHHAKNHPNEPMSDEEPNSNKHVSLQIRVGNDVIIEEV